MLTIYNSLTKEKETFHPIHPGKVSMYVCGMTVYDYCHIGHARVMVNFDFIARYFRHIGYTVDYVRNITDIDDKIIKRAHEHHESISDLTDRFITAMHDDVRALNVLMPSQEPRATDYIPMMQTMISTLLDRGHAYVSSRGDVLYDVSSFPAYGRLAHKTLDDLQAGARVAVTEDKQDPLDFVLWKKAKPGEPSWPSPWGDGRPGWHIECSAMSSSCLGHSIDIHGGGADLKFPHHENEIAQSEAANQTKFVNYWLHVGFITVNKEKMSKSLNNFFTIREVLARYRPEVIRYFMIASHYRSPINYSEESLMKAEAGLTRFYQSLRDLMLAQPLMNTEYEARFLAAMDDDFNTPEALAVLFDMTHEINRLRDTDTQKASGLGALLRSLGGILGLLADDPITFLQYSTPADDMDNSAIQALIEARERARVDKDWKRADEIRDQLTALHIILEDGVNGTQWRRG